MASNSDSVEPLKDTLKSCLDSLYSKIEKAFNEDSLRSFASELFSAKLITTDTKGKPTYEAINNELKSMIDLQKTHEKLEAFFFKVVMLMGKSSGPPEEASMRLEELVITEVEKKNGLKFVIRHTSIQESGSCGNSLHQKLYKNYSYYNSSNQVSTKHSQAQAAWSIGHDQPMMQVFSDPHPLHHHDTAWVELLVAKLQEEVESLTSTLTSKSQKLAEAEKKISDLEKRLNETGKAGLEERSKASEKERTDWETDSNEQNNYRPPTSPQSQDPDLYESEMVLGASEATMDVCRKDVRITALEVELRERNRQLNERDMQLSEKVTEIKELKEERKKLLAEKDRLYQELLSRR